MFVIDSMQTAFWWLKCKLHVESEAWFCIFQDVLRKNEYPWLFDTSSFVLFYQNFTLYVLKLASTEHQMTVSTMCSLSSFHTLKSALLMSIISLVKWQMSNSYIIASVFLIITETFSQLYKYCFLCIHSFFTASGWLWPHLLTPFNYFCMVQDLILALARSVFLFHKMKSQHGIR